MAKATQVQRHKMSKAKRHKGKTTQVKRHKCLKPGNPRDIKVLSHTGQEI